MKKSLAILINTIPTGNPKVYKAKVNGIIDEETFIQFYQSIHGLTPQEIVKKLQEFVPEFTRPGRHIVG